jgi:hypothetical protein
MKIKNLSKTEEIKYLKNTVANYLSGFMDADEFESVLVHEILPSKDTEGKNNTFRLIRALLAAEKKKLDGPAWYEIN